MYEIRHYLTAEGKDPVLEWLKHLRDPIAKVQIVKRLNRLEQGNLGDHRFCRDGLSSLKSSNGNRLWAQRPASKTHEIAAWSFDRHHHRWA